MYQMRKFFSWFFLILFSLLFFKGFSLFAQITFEEHTLDSNFDAWFIQTHDFDGDGDQDILSGYFKLALWKNNGSGNFSKSFIDNGLSELWSLFVVDLDRDGDNDILTAEYTSQQIAWYKNNGSYFERIVIQENFIDAESVAAADFDDDGDIDVVALTVGTHTPSGLVSWWKNDGHMGFSKRDLDTDFARGHKIEVGDIDNDGDVDIIACAASSKGISCFRNLGNGQFSRYNIYNRGSLGMSVIDFDKDGDLDIISTQHSDGNVTLSKNSGSGSFSNIRVATGLNWPTFAVGGDINNDGLNDIVVSNNGSDDIIWLENNGNDNFTQHQVGSGVDGPFTVRVADFNGDGYDDILSGSKNDSQIKWWKTISAQPAKSISILYPKGGEVISSDQQVEVQYSTSGNVGNVEIEFSSDNGSSWQTIVSSISNTGSYFWDVPIVNSNNCLIRISEAGSGNSSDISDNVFTVFEPKSITLLEPNGGDTLIVGELFDINWSSTGQINQVDFHFSNDNGNSWQYITSISNSGNYVWQVPPPESNLCQIRISETGGSILDINDLNFTIVEIPPNKIVLIDSLNNSSKGEVIGGQFSGSGGWTPIDWNDLIQYDLNNYYSKGRLYINVRNFDPRSQNSEARHHILSMYSDSIGDHNNWSYNTGDTTKKSVWNLHTGNNYSGGVKLLSIAGNKIETIDPNLNWHLDSTYTFFVSWDLNSVKFYIDSVLIIENVNTQNFALRNIFVGRDYTRSLDVNTGLPNNEYLPQYGPVYSNLIVYGDSLTTNPDPTNGELRLLFPDGGEIFNVGEQYDILWNSTGPVNQIDLHFSHDNGNTWQYITTVSNSENYLWQVPAVPSSLCLIKISETGGPIFDINDSNFIIEEMSPDTILTQLIVEAENMHYKSSGGSIINGWELDQAGYLSHSVYFEAGKDFLFNVFVKGEPALTTLPQMRLEIDGVQMAPAKISNQNIYQQYSFYSHVTAGKHLLNVVFVNYINPQKLQFDKVEIIDSGFDDEYFMAEFSNSIIQKIPNPANYGLYDWTMSTMILGLQDSYDHFNDPQYLTYIQSWIDGHMDGNGGLDDDLTRDWTTTCYTLYWLYETTGLDKYLSPLLSIDSTDVNQFLRISNGAFIHRNADQIWVDSIHGLTYYLIALYKANNNQYFLSELVDQIIYHADLLQDETTGLFYHAYDQDGSAAWSDPSTHLSPCFWARGNGWIILSIVDLLEILPQDFPNRGLLIQILEKLALGFINYQDADSGLWFTVIDEPDREGNYIETSASSLIAGSLAKAIKLGFLQNQFNPNANQANLGLNRKVYKDFSGIFYMTDISAGTSPGDYDYYSSINTVDGFTILPDGSSVIYGNGLLLSEKSRFISNFLKEISISGEVTYYSNNLPVADVLINLQGDFFAIDTTKGDGRFLFSPLINNRSYIFYPYKNNFANIGTIITSFDAALTARYAIGLEQFSNFQKKAADVDKNNLVLTYDAALIARHAVDLPPLQNTYAGFWIFDPDTVRIQSLPNNLANVQFQALVLGDISGAWQGSYFAKNFISDENFLLKFQSENIVQNADTIIYKFDFPASENILSFDLWMNYSDQDYQFLKYQISPEPSEFQIILNNSPGKLRIGGYSLNYLSADCQLQVSFVPKNTNAISDIIIEKFIINNRTIITNIPIDQNSYNYKKIIPESFKLYQNYPNPFNSETSIRYDLSQHGEVIIKIYDLRGRIVKNLFHGERGAGEHQITWYGDDQFGNKITAGIYLLQFNFNNKMKYVLKINYLP